MRFGFVFNYLLIAAHYLVAFGQDEECEDKVADILLSHLSDNVIPKYYLLSMTFDLDSGVFSGTVSITVEFDPSISPGINPEFDNYIYLHAHSELNIIRGNTQLQSEAKENISIKRECRLSGDRYWVIEVASLLPKGKYTIKLEFNGNMTNPLLTGIHSSHYPTKSYENAYLIFTKFHRTNARTVFPCFDEPRFKSEFEIQIKHQSRYNVRTALEITNTEEAEEDWTVSHFHSPGIPTPAWLVGININQFTETHRTDNGIEFRIWSRPEFSDAREFALDFNIKVLQFYNSYFTGLPYPMKKLDYIGLPTELCNFLGMEQWSLISARETNLLWKEGESNIESKMEAAGTLSHEPSHEWFANRVSIKHWKEEWLNEGFASWMQYKGVEAIEPSWKYQDDRLTHAGPNAYMSDSIWTAQAVVRNVEWHKVYNPDNSILYNKGATLLFMMEDHMGEEEFKKALLQYLHDHNDGTATTEDLWKSFQKVVKETFDVAAVYDTWVKKPGFPYIEVIREENQVILKQRRFFSRQSDFGTEKSIWPIPIKYYMNGNVDFKLFTGETMTIDIPKEEPFLLNVKHLGFYIIWYKDWSQLSPVIGSAYLSDMDYAGLMLDINHLTRFKQLHYNEVLRVFGQILNVTEHFATWKMATNLIIYANKYMKTRENTRKKFANLVVFWVQAKYDSYMWNEKDKSVPQIRFAVTIIDLACYYGLPKCLEDAKRHFDEWRDNETKLTPNVRTLVYNYGLKASNDVEDLEYVWAQYVDAKDTPLVSWKSELKRALSFVSNEDLVDAYMDHIESLPTSDFNEFLANLISNPYAVNHAWLRFSDKEFFGRLRKSLSDGILGMMILNFAKRFSEESRKREIDQLVGGIDSFGRRQKEAENEIENNKEWLKTFGEEFVIPGQ